MSRNLKQVIFFSIVLLLLFVLFFLGCKREYKVEGRQVYFLSWNEGSGSSRWLIDSADGRTFKTLDIRCKCNFTIGADANHLFFDGELVKNIDPHSFKFIGNYVFRDKDSAYFFGFFNRLDDCTIHNVNPDKIDLIDYPWARAGNILIHGRDTVTLEDIEDFVPIDKDWGKTKSKILYENMILPDADVETFQIVNSFTGQDKNHLFEFGRIKK